MLENSVGPALARLRKRRGLTQAQLAAKIGLTDSSVSRVEAEDGNPRLSTISRYLEALGFDLSDLAGESGPASASFNERLVAVESELAALTELRNAVAVLEAKMRDLEFERQQQPDK